MSGHFPSKLLRHLNHRNRTLDPLTICKREEITIVRTPMFKRSRSALVDIDGSEFLLVNERMCPSESMAAIWHEIGHHYFPPGPGDNGDCEANQFASAAILKQSYVLIQMCCRCQRCGVANPIRDFLQASHRLSRWTGSREDSQSTCQRERAFRQK